MADSQAILEWLEAKIDERVEDAVGNALVKFDEELQQVRGMIKEMGKGLSDNDIVLNRQMADIEYRLGELQSQMPARKMKVSG
jgi:chaperonin cofactor prefoldin